MPMYKTILAAIDLNEEAEQIITRASELSNIHQAELILLHVVEPVGYAYGGDIPMDLTELQDQLDKSARDQLTDLGHKHGVDDKNLIVTVGRPESEIHRTCEERDVTLIVVGSHGRHGIQLLLGSTANGVLHGAKCDVLAVRIN